MLPSYGSVLYFISSNPATVNLDGGSFDALNGQNSGQLFYISHTGSSFHTVTLTSSPSFSSVYAVSANGCFFNLYYVVFVDV